MKNLKGLLAVFAFVFAIGVAFAFAPSTTLVQNAKALENCSITGQVADNCTTESDEPACTFSILGTQYTAVAQESECAETNILRQPEPMN